jgi:hypothetical protein
VARPRRSCLQLQLHVALRVLDVLDALFLQSKLPGVHLKARETPVSRIFCSFFKRSRGCVVHNLDVSRSTLLLEDSFEEKTRDCSQKESMW